MNLILDLMGNLHPATTTISLFVNLSKSPDFHPNEAQVIPLSNKNTQLSSLTKLLGRDGGSICQSSVLQEEQI